MAPPTKTATTTTTATVMTTMARTGRLRVSSATEDLDTEVWDEDFGASRPVIQWYPGHIAKAEKLLVDCIKRVDVVIELRDARIPSATAHPLVENWVGEAKPRLVVFARQDMVPPGATDEWRKHLSTSGEHHSGAPLFWINSKRGTGVRDVRKAILAAGAYVNKRRARRGIRPRAVRAAIIGFPNVGKVR